MSCAVAGPIRQRFLPAASRAKCGHRSLHGLLEREFGLGCSPRHWYMHLQIATRVQSCVLHVHWKLCSVLLCVRVVVRARMSGRALAVLSAVPQCVHLQTHLRLPRVVACGKRVLRIVFCLCSWSASRVGHVDRQT